MDLSTDLAQIIRPTTIKKMFAEPSTYAVTAHGLFPLRVSLVKMAALPLRTPATTSVSTTTSKVLTR